MRRLLVAFVAIWVSPVAAAEKDLIVWVDVDGTAYLRNTTAAPLSFDGYQIVSETRNLDPVGWRSIQDAVVAAPLDVIAALGAGALAFGEANPNEGNLAELNLAGSATLAANAKFAIGKPFKTWAPHPPEDCYFIKIPTSPNSGPLACFPTPEPSSLVLAGIGLVCATGFIQRAKRPRRRDARSRSES